MQLPDSTVPQSSVQSIISMTRLVAIEYLFTEIYRLSTFPLSVYTKFNEDSGSRTADSRASYMSNAITWFPIERPPPPSGHLLPIFRFLRNFTTKLYYFPIKFETQVLLYILQDIPKLHRNRSNISWAATAFYKALLEPLNPRKALLRCFNNSL